MAALAAELDALCGDDEALDHERVSLQAQAGRVGDRRRLATLDRALGLRALADGRLDEATVSLTRAAAQPFLGRGLRDAVIPARVDLVEVCSRKGDVESCRLQAETVRPILVDMDDPLAEALVHRIDALTGDDPVSSFTSALEAHARARDPFEEARTRLLLGEYLRRNRQRSAARTALHDAALAFETLGAQPWATRAHGELRACGSTIHSSVDLDVLTPQERAVAEAAAEGRSNREVAEALFLSPKTVEYHLGNAYRKLEIKGRAELTRRLREQA